MSPREMSQRGRLSASACLITTLFACQIVHGAEVPATIGSSSGHGASIDLSVLGIINSNRPNLGRSSGTAPAPYTDTRSAVNLNVRANVLLLDLVSADGVITSTSSSTIDGLPGAKTTKASAEVANLALSVARLPLSQPLISIQVPAVKSEVTIAGQGASYTTNSSVSLAGLNLKILGLTIDLSTINLTNVPPNTGVQLGAGAIAGLSIILNETETIGDGFGGYSTTTNAIRIKLEAVDLGLLEVLNGDIIIGHAQALHGSDHDGDGVMSGIDGDSDGDGIPNAVEIANARPGGDSDGDGVPDHYDLDSDNDGINDVIEAGGRDINGDGRQDPSGDSNPDEDRDGIVDSVDPDDAVPGGRGVALTIPDTDGDGIKNYLDLDSDNDGISDVAESGHTPANDFNGVFRSGDSDGDGIDDLVDGFVGVGDAPSSSGPILDSDNDGIPDAYDSDKNGVKDIIGTPYASFDVNGDGRIDSTVDVDRDGIPDVVDIQPGVFGGLPNPSGDNDGDGISNEDEGSGLVDTDGDGIPDMMDGDSDGDGIPDAIEGNGDFDGDGIPNSRDLDSDNDGINDVIEAGGTDANGDGLQDPSGDGNPDEDRDGIVDSVDPDDNVAGGGKGQPLPVPDTDGDGARDFVDLDSDNDTISDLVESGLGATDTNNDGVGDGPDVDRDGIVESVDGLPNARGDAGGSTPLDTDGDGIPNYIDPNSDGSGAPDIVMAGNGDLDADGDGKVDNITDADGDGIPDVADSNNSAPGGLSFNLKTYDQWRNEEFAAPANSDPLISGKDADPDSDGFSNAEEFAFGSNPQNSASYPTITGGASSGGGVQLSGAKARGVYAFIYPEVSRDTREWSRAPEAIIVTADTAELLIAEINNVTFAGDKNRGFIRFHIIIP